jgi:4-amino-4-deoxy-L-arabinose transferase-like glycosyltransferase
MDALAATPRQGRDRRHRDCLLPILLLSFVAGLFPFAADYILFHPDERHYVDAGMGMLRSGDFLTPRHANGDLRLKKPLLPYWVAAAGFGTVGVSPLGGRIGFLLLGAAVVGLTWKTACLASTSPESRPPAPRVALEHRPSCGHASRNETPAQRTHFAGLLAAAVAACHPALLVSAPRSVPDVCLALGVAISQWGFVGILAHGTMRRPWIAAAFGGGAIAVLSKGLPGGVFLAFASAFLVWRRPSLALRHWRALLSAAFISAAISASWFAFIAANHQDEFARQFVNDQIGSQRFVENGWHAAAHFPAYALIIAATLLPWLTTAGRSRLRPETTQYTDDAEANKSRSTNRARFSRYTSQRVTGHSVLASTRIQLHRSRIHFFRSFRAVRGSPLVSDCRRRPHVQLLLGWTLLYCGLASFVNHVSPRYLLPVVPALAILTADVLGRIDADSLRRGLRRLLSASAVAAIVAVAIALLLIGLMNDAQASRSNPLTFCTLLGIGGLALLIWRLSTGRGRAGQVAAIAITTHATLLAAGVALHSLLPDSFAAQVRTQLNAAGLQQGRLVVVGAPAHATRLRVELDGRFEVVWAGDTTTPRDVRPSDIIVVDEEITAPPQLSGYRMQRVTCGYRQSEARDVIAALLSGRLRQFLSLQQKRYIVATPHLEEYAGHGIRQVGWEQPAAPAGNP